MRNAGARVMVTEADPICALQAAMEGYEVVTMDDAASRGDIFVTATGNTDIITARPYARDEGRRDRLQYRPFRQRDSGGEALTEHEVDRDQAAGRPDRIPDGKQILLLAKGRLVNLGCATGHPSFVMSASFTNQTLAQIELWQNAENYEKQVYVLPKALDEKVAALHLEKVGAKLTKLSEKQASYIGVTPEGPFKPEAYRY